MSELNRLKIEGIKGWRFEWALRVRRVRVSASIRSQRCETSNELFLSLVVVR